MKNKIKEFWEKFQNSKKTQIITVVSLLVILLIIILLIIFTGKTAEDQQGNDNANISQIENNEPANRVIDGVETTADRANLLPTAIVVENFQTVRPQSGLSKANIVYEALAEGGITRFLAIYANGEDIKTIGPVRSARGYFVDIAEEYGGTFAHVGGSPQALGILSFEEYLTDLNQFTYSQYYWRDENIPAPHNVFTSSELMSYAIRDLISENPEGDYEPWQFKDEDKEAALPENGSLIIDYSSADYETKWMYNKEENNYIRYNGGEEHKDANTDEVITAKNIIVQFAATGLLPNETERLDIELEGTGTVYIFMDGEKIEGTWEKENRGDRTKFYNTDSQEIEFNRGTTWVEIVKEDTDVEWTN